MGVCLPHIHFCSSSSSGERRHCALSPPARMEYDTLYIRDVTWWFRVAEDEERKSQSVYHEFSALEFNLHWEFVGHLWFRAKTVGEEQGDWEGEKDWKKVCQVDGDPQRDSNCTRFSVNTVTEAFSKHYTLFWLPDQWHRLNQWCEIGVWLSVCLDQSWPGNCSGNKRH